MPPRSAPVDYTKFFVENAVIRYDTQGLDATLSHYNREENIDGQLYVFIVDEDGMVIGHPDSERLGLDLKGWVGTDANGYKFGQEMLSATEDGKWMSYVYRNPESSVIGADFGQWELKNVWVVRHDGLLLASGWYIGAEKFTKQLVSVAVDRFQTGGLEATVEYFASPESALAGLENAVNYYNNTETLEGEWFAFIADGSGLIAAHSDPQLIGQNIHEVFGEQMLEASSGGDWVTTESMRFWVENYQEWLFGSGWRNN